MESMFSTFAATTFALLNPLGMLPVFIGYTEDLGAAVQRWLALLVALTVLGLMLLFLLTGNSILGFFGITLDSFRMAGGILLLIIGIRIVTADAGQTAVAGKDSGRGTDLDQAASVYRRIVVPFAMPLLVGPGVIANLVLYAGEAKRLNHDGLLLGLVGVLVGVSCVTLVILLAARSLRRLLGEVGLSIVTRILGLLVAAIRMQFVITGLSDTIVHVIAPALRA